MFLVCISLWPFLFRINNWIPAPKPKIFRDTNITLLQNDEISPHVRRLLFQASGPDHMGIYFSPKSGVKLATWSFSDGQLLEGPKWKDDRPTYYIFHSHGLSPAPWQFWLQFKVNNWAGVFLEKRPFESWLLALQRS